MLALSCSSVTAAAASVVDTFCSLFATADITALSNSVVHRKRSSYSSAALAAVAAAVALSPPGAAGCLHLVLLLRAQ